MNNIRITLPADTPCYVLPEHSRILIKKDRRIPAGTPLAVGRIEKLIFDRRPEEAVPFQYFGETRYVLLRQLYIAGIKERLRAFSNLHLVEKPE